jgi:hypothetical protein
MQILPLAKNTGCEVSLVLYNVLQLYSTTGRGKRVSTVLQIAVPVLGNTQSGLACSEVTSYITISVALVRKRPPLVGEVSVNFCG